MPLVLLVEDHDDTREMMVELLRNEGYEVLEAANGQRALDLLTEGHSRKPDLILLDIAMPVMSGTELLRVLEDRGMLSSLPVVVVSAHLEPADAPGARAFLRKPASMVQLFKTIRQLCPV